MRTFLFITLILLVSISVNGQRLKVRQSMETAELREEPAQFQVTAPVGEKASFLFNGGLSYRVNSSAAPGFLSKAIVEYHRNTALDKEQNNLSAGYGYTLKLGTFGTTDVFSAGDLKYIYDRVDSTHSVGGNILFTWYRDNSPLNWNTNNFYRGNSRSLFVSLYGGTQYQGIFKADKSGGKGFILRPLYTANISYAFTDPAPGAHPPIVRFAVLYTGRYDVVNSSDNKENYTRLLKTSADWFVVRGNIKVSLGVSYNTGSDPMQGLKTQSYWLFSLNFLK